MSNRTSNTLRPQLKLTNSQAEQLAEVLLKIGLRLEREGLILSALGEAGERQGQPKRDQQTAAPVD